MRDEKKMASIVVVAVAIMIAVIVFLLIKDTKAVYQVSFFDGEGGKLLAVQQIQKGNNAIKPEDPIVEGDQFLGWYLGEELFDFSTPIKSNFSLIAKWEFNITPTPTIYTITLNDEGEITTVSTDENGLIQEPETPTKKGYTFTGWFVNDEKVDFAKPFTEDIEIVAKWEKAAETEKQEQTKVEATKKENVKKVSNNLTTKVQVQASSDSTSNESTSGDTTSSDATSSENSSNDTSSSVSTPSESATSDTTPTENTPSETPGGEA